MICISAGHHPTKPGACYNGFCEHDEAMRWVSKIAELLGDDRCVIVPPAPLKTKVEFINARSPVIAAEIHFNSDEKRAGNGCLTLHHPESEKGKKLARLIQDNMEQIFTRHWNGVMEGWYRMNKDYGPDFILAKTKCPTVIIEPEFIHNKELILKNRDVCCSAIAEALASYLEG